MTTNPTDDTDGTNARLNRRRVLRNVGILGVGAGFGTGTAAAGGPPPGKGKDKSDQRGGNGNSGGPPEKCTCPDDSFIAKYEVVSDADGCRFELAEGDDVVEFVGWNGKEDTDCEPLSVSYRVPGYQIDSVCAFGGTDTDSGEPEPDEDGVYTLEPQLTNPGGQRAAISNLSVCGSEIDDEVDPECAALSVSYECTTYNEERAGGVIENWRRTGTRVRVTNTGAAPARYGEAVSNDVTSFEPVGTQTVAADDTRTFVSDSSVPQRVIVFWEGSPECADRLDLETWGEFKNRRGFADLDAFYNGTSPADAPADLDDSLYVAEAQNLPEESEPDLNISPTQYPDVSDEAEAAGWTTCAKQA